jgi:hypothetical protein
MYFYSKAILVIVLSSFCLSHRGYTQERRFDSISNAINQIPVKYYKVINAKANQYSKRIVNRTNKTLRKLSIWESKVKKILDKVSPKISEQLFANEKLTFKKMYDNYQQAYTKTTNLSNQLKSYNKYRDELTTGIKFINQYKGYIDSSNSVKLICAETDIRKMNSIVINQLEIESHINKRKKEIIKQLKGNVRNVILKRLNKETYYYSETIKNYREILSDPTKLETLVASILKNIPEFNSFFSSASLQSALFRAGQNPVDLSNVGTLQTRASINQLLSQNPITGNQVNVNQLLNQQASKQLNLINELKQKAAIGSRANDETASEEKFKPNTQRSKLFRQRILYDYNLQWERQNQFYPTTAAIGLSVGYKLNDLSCIGFGVDYRGGIGSIEKLSFTHQGLAMRVFADYKFIRSFALYAGADWVRNQTASNAKLIPTQWQLNGSLGLKKQITKAGKSKRKGYVILTYDWYQSNPIPQASRFKIRYGFNLK